MKRVLLLNAVLATLLVLVFAGCKDDPTPLPCNGTGQVCITNKMDSTVTINILQNNLQLSIDRDNMECLTLTGGVAYTFNITMNSFYKDTTILVSNCDYENLVLE
jgi:hypothetical protein